MCGISVIVNTRNAPVPNQLISSMNARIAHRGPDNEGIYHGCNFALGHRRLSIVDTSHLAHQPFQFGEYIIIFNGEIYNHYELRQELHKKGYSFSTRSDTEVILAAYDLWGNKCVSYFEGMWSFVIYDIKKNVLLGSRDRFGQKPFHYGQFGNYFIVASEIKQFMEVPGFKTVLNEEVAFNYLNYEALSYSDETFFEGVRSLSAGHNLEYDLHKHSYTISKWYSFPQARAKKIDLHEAGEEFRRLFEVSVSTRLNGDVRIGSCLSGGLDSSSIVCMADKLLDDHKELHKDLLTLSICWNDESIDERPFIDLVSTYTGITNRKIFPGIDELGRQDVLGKIIYHQDQPIPSASHYAEFKVYEAARANALPVMLDGQGADEYLGGYGIFNWYNLQNLFNENRFLSMGQEWIALRRTSNFSDNEMLRNFLFIKYKQRKPRLASFLNAEWAKQHFGENPYILPEGNKMSMRNLSYHQLFVSSLPHQLHSADRNSMCHAVEARLPFLDHRLVEFSYSLPDEFKISKGLSKVILRQALGSMLPRAIRKRQLKLGFPAPERQWMHSNADWVGEELDASEEVAGKFIDYPKLRESFNSFRANKQQDHSLFFRVISLAKWLKIFNIAILQLAVACL